MAIHVILAGRMASGKTTLAKLLEKKGFDRIVTYTTRPIRHEEQSGIDYHFISEEEFLSKKEAGFFAETDDFDSRFGHVYFGSAIQDYKSEHDTVIILNPAGIKSVMEKGINARIIYIRVPAEVGYERAVARGDVPEEVRRRVNAENETFRVLESEGRYTDMLDLKGDEPQETVLERLMTLIYEGHEQQN